MMLSQNGLGKDRTIYKEFEMYINDEPCNQNGQISIPKDFIKIFNIDKVNSNYPSAGFFVN
jgi:hypothetical protein